MGISDWLGLGNAIEKPIKAVGDLYTTDKARLEAQAKVEEIIQKPELAQLENNRIFAMSQNLFNSGWQSLTGWTAGFLVLIYYFPQITIATWVWGNNCLDTGVVKPFPIAPDDILNLVYLLFGFGAHHIVHKIIKK